MTLDKLATYAARVGGIVTAFIACGGFLVFMLNNEVIKNYLKEAVSVTEVSDQVGELGEEISGIKNEVRVLSSNVNELTHTLEEVARVGELSTLPVIKFLEGSYLTDGRIGGSVRFNMRFVKIRECGTADLAVWFKNGVKTIHAFEAVSIINEQGRSLRTIPSAPGEVLERAWTARIPLNDGVTAGRGEAWLEISYPDCPLVVAETSPIMPFEILDDDGRPVEREKE
jgi:hypothetical protein